MMRVVAGLCLLVLVSACQETMSADVTRFNDPSGAMVGQSFVFVPEGEQKGALDFRRYARLVAGNLVLRGLGPETGDEKTAGLVVLLRYGSAGDRTRVYSYGGSYYDGWYRGPGYGWGGFNDGGVDSYPLYSQKLEVDILDGPSWRADQRRMLFQGRVVGESGIRDINGAMPYLVRALFADFPGSDGRTVHLRLPLED